MKKIFTFFSTAIFLIACAGMTGCNKNEPEPSAEAQTYHVSIQAGKSDTNQQKTPRKALGLEGNTLTASWASGERVSVRNLTKNADLGGYLAAETSGNPVIISGDLTGTINAGDELEFKFLSPDYTNQEGTIEYISSHCDYAVATIHVASVTWGSITFEESVADFENRQAVVKFILKDEATDAALAATKLEVDVEGESYTITPASATNEIFVALPGFSDQTIKLTATVGSDTYTFTSPSGKTFEDGKYYVITVGLSQAANVHGFSVSPTKQIEFAHGNLQYQPSTGTWRIARNQYDFVGYEYAFASNGILDRYSEHGNVYENNVKCDNLTDNGEYFLMVDNSYSGWIDLFGWNTAENGINTSLYARDYASAQTDFVDWGHNAIYDPKANITYPADTWRTLSVEEYQYLLFTRPNASQLVGTASIEDHPNGPVKGIIILPDDFVLPDGLSFKGANQTHSYTSGYIYTYKESVAMFDMTPSYFASDDYVFNQNRYTLAQWEQLEAAGAVFLPAAGERIMYYNQDPLGAFEEEGATYTLTAIYVFYIGQKAVYWTSTRSGEDGVNYLREAKIVVCSVDNYQLSAGEATMTVTEGQSVRLVRDLQ